MYNSECYMAFFCVLPIVIFYICHDWIIEDCHIRADEKLSLKLCFSVCTSIFVVDFIRRCSLYVICF